MLELDIRAAPLNRKLREELKGEMGKMLEQYCTVRMSYFDYA